MNKYEVHGILDKFTGEPSNVMTCDIYEEAEEIYNEIVAEGQPARLLLVDEDGMPLNELKSNY